MKDTEVEDTLRALYAAIEEREGRWFGRHGELQLSSSFQPVFSFPHARPVGYEALVRVQDGAGQAVSPVSLFERVDSFEQQVWLDRLCRLLHVHNFCTQTAQADHEAWLFLNVHPAVLVHSTRNAALMQRSVDLLHQLGIPMNRLVLEVTEEVMAQDHSFEDAVAWARSVGCLLALDDFGAGHSNFDRVWRIRPEIVKLDRSLVRRALQSPSVARMMAQVVSLLHECGSLALLEGVENEREAQIALDADVDLVQGFAFGRPLPSMPLQSQASGEIEALWNQFDAHLRARRSATEERLQPYQTALALALLPLQQGKPLREAAEAFLRLPGCQLVFQLDTHGRLVGERASGEALRPPDERFAPLDRAGDARFARRPYFRRAMDHVGEVQVTRPYLSLHGARLCVTVSLAFWHQGELRVLCGDVDWGQPD